MSTVTDDAKVLAVQSRRWVALVGVLVLFIAACSGGSASSSTRRSSTTVAAPDASTCGSSGPAPDHYESVVVFSFENRRWDEVGEGFGPKMPYLHALGGQCSWFPKWTETDPRQNSLTQYVGQVTGAPQPGTVNDCSPSPRCSTQADSIFRQVRQAGRRAVNYVEGATEPCSADGNAVRHVPALYLWSAEDRAHCTSQVRPLAELDVRHLPAFTFVTPTECHDGHDCSDRTVDSWARDHVQPVLDSAAYRAGKVAVFVWYDEDTPVPNLWITPTATRGPVSTAGAGAPATLRAWQSMLDVPCLANACTAADLRSVTRS